MTPYVPSWSRHRAWIESEWGKWFAYFSFEWWLFRHYKEGAKLRAREEWERAECSRRALEHD